ncbi:MULTISPECIES: ROK family transcriptional regulator [unclassified Kribbella]|uniref:ROK family transcriptional regulator n=1 Tax=unclassified Kribbella TaxID=2644121 RepID=UPI0030183E4A
MMDELVAVGTELMRGINADAVLRQLRTESSMTVSALAKKVGLSRQAVTRSLVALEAEGLVEFSAPERNATKVGRPAQRVRFRAEAGSVLGLSISPQDVRVALSDLAGAVIATNTVQLDPGTSGAEGVEALIATVQATIADADIWFATVGAPGIVDLDAQVIKLIPSMPGLAGDIVVRRLSDVLTCPVYLDNDVKLATQGERWRGAQRREDSVVMIHWGERVGAGIVMQGELYRGASNDSGDIGFLDLLAGETRKDGLGPFEDWVGADEIVRLAGLGTFDEVLDAYSKQHPAAVSAIETVAGRFAKGVAAIRSILDPQLVVIGGPMARCGEPLLEAIRGHLEHQALNQPPLAVSSLGDDAVVYGALHHCLVEIERTRFERVRSSIRRAAARGPLPAEPHQAAIPEGEAHG